VTAALAWGVLLHINDVIVGAYDSDNYWFAWSGWNFGKALRSGHDPGYTHSIYALTSAVPIFTDGFFNQLLAWFLQTFLSPIGAYNLVVLLTFPLSGVAMFMLASQFARGWIAPAAAGFMYTFSTYHFARAEFHLGLVTLELLPFAAWTVLLFRREARLSRALLAGIGVGLIAWADVYYVAYFLLPMVVLTAAAMLVWDRSWLRQRRNLFLAAGAGAVACLVAIPALYPYFLVEPGAQSAITEATVGFQKRIYSADLAAYLLPDPVNPLFGHLTQRFFKYFPTFPERSVLPGDPLLLLALLGLFAARSQARAAIFWFMVAVVGGVLSLGPDVHVAGHVVMSLPFYDLVFDHGPLASFRTPSRLSVLPLVALPVLAAIGIEAVGERRSHWAVRRVVLGGMLAGLLVFSLLEALLFSVSMPTLAFQPPRLYESIAADPGGLLLDIPVYVPSAQYLQVIHGHALVGGHLPRDVSRAQTSLDNVPYLSDLLTGSQIPANDAEAGDIYPLPSFRQGLVEKGIRWVVLHRFACLLPGSADCDPQIPGYGAIRNFLLASLGQPDYEGNADGLTAWRVTTAPVSPSPTYRFELGDGWIYGITTGADAAFERFTGPEAKLLIHGPAGPATLRFRASAALLPTTMEVLLDGQRMAVVQLSHPGVPLTVDLGQIDLRGGTDTLELRSRQGCATPYQLNHTVYDGRCLSLGIQSLELNAI